MKKLNEEELIKGSIKLTEDRIETYRAGEFMTNNRMTAPSMGIAGVYFLIKNNKIVYIGQSKNLSNRIADHIEEKDFDKYTWLEIKIENLDYYESYFYYKFKPELNNKNRIPIRKEDLTQNT